ncbi:hypothetical protein DSECCO2_586740 [anaerobic digester metagenome]
MNLSDTIACTTSVTPMAAIMSPMLATNKLPTGMTLPRKLKRAFSAETKNKIFPLFNKS